ncbi:MAG: hypothetical protein HFI08_02035 [Bacilli bacterium]|jgi:hypothetical protein|nr:hypothetical protein [Bacilli bacterium]
MTFTGTKEEIKKWLFNKESNIEFEIKVHKEKRSLNANAYFHSLINKLARYYNWSDEEMKIKMVLDYGTLAEKDGEVVSVEIPRNLDIQLFYPYAKYIETKDGKDSYLFYKRTHELNTHEFYELLCGVVQECKDVGIPTKEDYEIQKMIEEMEKYENN